jgi:hypothetical protein
MQVIDKFNNDILFGAVIMVGRRHGEELRAAAVSSFDRVYYTFYTQDPANNIVCKYEQGVYDGILHQEDGDFCILDVADLSRLEDGLLRYSFKYVFFTAIPEMEDGIFSGQNDEQTEIYLQTHIKTSFNEDC